MEVNEAAEIILKVVHDDINGRIIFSDFLAHQTEGYDERTSVDIMGIYNKALLVLMDEKLCNRGAGADIIELGQKGIACKGNYRKYLKKKNTATFLDKARRIAPILSFIIVFVTFVITMVKRENNIKRTKAKVVQSRKDSILHGRARK